MLRSQVNGKLAVHAEMEFAAFTVNTAMFIFKTSRAYTVYSYLNQLWPLFW